MKDINSEKVKVKKVCITKTKGYKLTKRETDFYPDLPRESNYAIFKDGKVLEDIKFSVDNKTGELKIRCMNNIMIIKPKSQNSFNIAFETSTGKKI